MEGSLSLAFGTRGYCYALARRRQDDGRAKVHHGRVLGNGGITKAGYQAMLMFRPSPSSDCG